MALSGECRALPAATTTTTTSSSISNTNREFNININTTPTPSPNSQLLPDVVELNVGGQVYFTRLCTLTSLPNSVLGRMFGHKRGSVGLGVGVGAAVVGVGGVGGVGVVGGASPELARDSRGRFFIDRDGFLFRYVLDYLRDRTVVLPELFPERQRLRREAEFFQLPELARMLSLDERDRERHSPGGGLADDGSAPHSDPEELSQGSDRHGGGGDGGERGGGGGGGMEGSVAERKAGFITLGYRGSCSLGRDNVQGDARLFRRVPRILVCGRIGLVKEVFGDNVNESRDPDRTPDRYTSRFYLRYRQLERAFDTLADSGFTLLGTNSSLSGSLCSQNLEDRTWNSYTEYLFYRSSSRWPSPQCDCGCRNHKGEKDGDSATSCNELSSSSCDSQSDASSPQETVICGPVTRQPNIQTLDRSNKKGPVQYLQQSELRRKSDLLRTLTSGSRESNACKKKVKEKLTIEEELEKCIQDFLKIKIPDRFPERKYPWQMDLLRKYHL